MDELAGYAVFAQKTVKPSVHLTSLIAPEIALKSFRKFPIIGFNAFSRSDEDAEVSKDDA